MDIVRARRRIVVFGLYPLLLLLLLPSTQIDGKEVPLLKIERVKCWSSGCDAFDCHIVRRSARVQVMSGFCNLRAPTDNVRVRVNMFYRYKRYMPFLYDADMDLCDYLGERKQTYLMIDMVRPYLEKYTTNVLTQRCPVTGNVTVHELEYDMQILGGIILPIGQYRCDIRVYESKTNATIYHVETYIRKLSEEFAKGR